MQRLQRIHLQTGSISDVLHAFDGGTGAGDGGEVRQAGGKRLRADRTRIRNGVATFLDRVDHQGDLAVLDHVDDVRPALGHLVHVLRRQAGSRNRCGRAAGGYDVEADDVEAEGDFDRAGL